MGATPQQLVDFYGWKSANMAQEYVSTSKFALQNMASKLAVDSAGTSSEEVPGSSEEVKANFELELPESVEEDEQMSGIVYKNCNIEKLVVIQNVQTFNM